LGCGTKIEELKSPKPIPLVEEVSRIEVGGEADQVPQERPPSVIIEEPPAVAPQAQAEDEAVAQEPSPMPSEVEPVEVPSEPSPTPSSHVEMSGPEPVMIMHEDKVYTESEPEPVATPQETPPPAGVNACPTCQKEVPAGFLFCGACGTRLPDPAASHTMYMHSAFKPDTQERICAKLVLIRPDGEEGDYFPIRKGANPVGREDGDSLFAQDNLLSPVHASFTFRDESLFAKDEGSLNGVYLKLNQETELHSGDNFRVGQQILCYEARDRFESIIKSLKSEDDSFVMGSPDLGYWGRLIQILAPHQNGNCYLLSGNEITLGRERSTITFQEDGFISSNHASLVHREQRTFLRDLGSTNGTYLRLHEETQLVKGDLLLLGQQLFVVEILG